MVGRSGHPGKGAGNAGWHHRLFHPQSNIVVEVLQFSRLALMATLSAGERTNPLPAEPIAAGWEKRSGKERHGPQFGGGLRSPNGWTWRAKDSRPQHPILHVNTYNINVITAIGLTKQRSFYAYYNRRAL